MSLNYRGSDKGSQMSGTHNDFGFSTGKAFFNLNKSMMNTKNEDGNQTFTGFGSMQRHNQSALREIAQKYN